MSKNLSYQTRVQVLSQALHYQLQPCTLSAEYERNPKHAKFLDLYNGAASIIAFYV
jgi:hypothetical protein